MLDDTATDTSKWKIAPDSDVQDIEKLEIFGLDAGCLIRVMLVTTLNSNLFSFSEKNVVFDFGNIDTTAFLATLQSERVQGFTATKLVTTNMSETGQTGWFFKLIWKGDNRFVFTKYHFGVAK